MKKKDAITTCTITAHHIDTFGECDRTCMALTYYTNLSPHSAILVVYASDDVKLISQSETQSFLRQIKGFFKKLDI